MGVGAVRKKPGPRFRTSIVVLGLGILLALPGVVMFGAGIWQVVFAPTISVPGTERLELGEGTHIVFERTGDQRRYGPVTIARNHGVTIDAAQLSVTGPDGTAVRVRNSIPNESIDRGSDHYVAAVEFDCPRAGTYTLRFRSTEPTRVIVGRPLGDVFRSRVPWLLDIALGWLVALVGVTMLFVGVFRRGRVERAAARLQIAPAGWFPDPLGEHRLRYWDGQEWTDHVAE